MRSRRRRADPTDEPWPGRRWREPESCWAPPTARSIGSKGSSTRSPTWVGEIAFRAGYTDELYFSRAFRRRYDVAPTEYRHAPTPASG